MSDETEKQSDEDRPFLPVTDEVDIRVLIREAVQTSAACQIWTKDQSQLFNSHLSSYLQEVQRIFAWIPTDLDQKQAKIDFEREKFGYFSLSLTGASVFFRSEYQGLDHHGIRFACPKEIHKVQRRKDFRLPIPDGYVVRVKFVDPLSNDNLLTRKIVDISAGGLCIIIDSDEEIVFKQGMILHEMQFKVREREIKAHGEIRYVKPTSKNARVRGLKVGIKFTQIRAADADHIAKYVFEESRKYITKFV